MTAHHLVNFAKVYGKYLVRSCLDGEFRIEACRLLDIFSMCLASSVAPDHVAKLREAIRLFCLHYNEVWPTQCKALVVHMVLFHMPDTIAYWGPARGYWCFPFERLVTNRQESSRIVTNRCSLFRLLVSGSWAHSGAAPRARVTRR